MSSGEISFYVDCLIVEALVADPSLQKQADGSMVASLIEKVKDYIGDHIAKSDDKLGSVLSILAPGAVFMLLRAMGLGWLGFLLSMAMEIFHIDVGAIWSSIYNSIKSIISGNQQVSSSQIDSIAQSAVQDHFQPATQEEATQIAQKLQSKSIDILRDARFVKLSLIQYQAGKLNKTAGILDAINSRKSKTSSILARVLGWIFKVVLASAGFMVAGDLANKLVGRPNALDGTLKNNQPVAQSTPMPTTTQTKFKVNPTYQLEHNNAQGTPWIEKINNNENAIGDMIIGFAKDVYDGLDNKENLIKGTAGYQTAVDQISWYNHTSPDAPLVFIPNNLNSKKQIVDTFIDDVASKSA